MDIAMLVIVFLERYYFWNMFNTITKMAAMEENISPSFRNFIKEMEEKVNTLYLESSDHYHELRHRCITLGMEPEILFAKRLNSIIEATDGQTLNILTTDEDLAFFVEKGGKIQWI